jgi:signal transduction histidine kinase
MSRATGSPTVSGVKSLEVRWPVVLGAVALAFFQTGGTIGASRNQTGDRGIDALTIAITVLGPLSLILLRRWPREVMAFVSAITIVYLLRDYAYGPVFACLAIATVSTVVLGHRLAAWLGLGAVLLGSFVALLPAFRDQSWSWGWFSGVLAWGLLVLAVGELLRSRRERSLAAREARAEAGRRRANEERLQIARELHDVVAHHISLINVQAGVALHIVDRHPEQAQTALTAIKDASKEALVELRSLVGVLRDAGESAPRTPSGGLASLDDLVERSAHAGLAVRKTERGEVRPLPSAVELAALRIVQEAITNVVRHSGASSATITLQYDADTLGVTVQDSGRGLAASSTPSAGTSGTGIVGMRERAEALGGSLQVGPGDAGGVSVHAVLPVRPTDAREER